MKKINKSLPPNTLTKFQASNSSASWDDFRNCNQGKDYLQAKRVIFADQGQLCAYCETRIESTPEQIDLQRVEHFHEKSDTTNAQKNWALDWANMIGVCLGGSGRDNKNGDGKAIFRTPENLSCDAFKGHLVKKGKLLADCEGSLINPLLLFASPNVFQLDRRTGMLKPNSGACTEVVIEGNKLDSTEELVNQTIEILNLNCDRLNKQRLEVFYKYEGLLKKAKRINNKAILGDLAKHWFGRHPWPSFFSTRRGLLGDHAENYLKSRSYDG